MFKYVWERKWVDLLAEEGRLFKVKNEFHQNRQIYVRGVCAPMSLI